MQCAWSGNHTHIINGYLLITTTRDQILNMAAAVNLAINYQEFFDFLQQSPLEPVSAMLNVKYVTSPTSIL